MQLNNIWEWLIIIMTVLGLGISIAKHGELEIKTHNFWVYLISYLIQLYLMYMAGLFR